MIEGLAGLAALSACSPPARPDGLRHGIVGFLRLFAYKVISDARQSMIAQTTLRDRPRYALW